MMRDKSDVIYEVLADPSKDEITDLHVSDLRALLDAVQAQGVQDNEGPPRDPDGYLSRPIRRDYR
jgi:hypothetical protein